MILQEDMMETVIDPFLLLFYVIATTIFVFTSYKKPELRLFIGTLVLMTAGITWCLIGLELLEASFTFAGSGVALLSAIILRTKTKMKGAQKSG